MRVVRRKSLGHDEDCTGGDGCDGSDVEKFKQQMIQEGWSLIEDQLKDGMKDKFSPTAAADQGQAGDFQNTVRDYLQTELMNHPDEEREALLRLAEGLLLEEERA